jgi:hypothetical protein
MYLSSLTMLLSYFKLIIQLTLGSTSSYFYFKLIYVISSYILNYLKSFYFMLL